MDVTMNGGEECRRVDEGRTWRGEKEKGAGRIGREMGGLYVKIVCNARTTASEVILCDDRRW